MVGPLTLRAMKTTGHTILVTGGASGIGLALAQSFLARGNRVIVAGRRQSACDEAVAANPGLSALTLDVASPDGIRSFVAELLEKHPTLDVVIHNAGIMRAEKLQEARLDDAEATIATNLLGPIRLNAALLPHLLQQKAATVMTVSSGLAFVPMAATPTYSATKAAIHAYTQSLRAQLQGTSVEVLELIPPAVQTELMPGHATSAHAMPLADYITEVMSILESQPDADEICVERVKPLRFAERAGKHADVFAMLNAPR